MSVIRYTIQLSLALMILAGLSVEAAVLDYRITVKNTSAIPLNNTPLTLAQPFLAGDIAEGESFTARIVETNTFVPVQTDKKASHPDNSLRHAVFSMVLPSLDANQTLTIEFVPTTSASSSPPVELADLIATGLQASVELQLAGVDYVASLSDVINTPIRQWLTGASVGEWIFSTPLKNVSDSSEHPHLNARFYVRKYADSDNIKIDFVIENNWVYVSAPQDFNYDAVLKINGGSVYQFSDLVHFSRARWKKTFWSQGEPAIHVAHASKTLIDSKVVPSYNPSLIGNIDTSGYQGIDYDVTMVVTGGTTGKYSPMGIGGIQKYMPSSGGRTEIGPLPIWAASYLLSQDVDSKKAMLAMGETGGSWGIHYRDKNTGLPLSIVDHPTLSIHVNAPVKPPSCTNKCDSPYTADDAHQPAFAYIPYLVTGDYFYLEELQFWVTYNLLYQPAGNPEHQSWGKYRERDRGLLAHGQIRARAWNLRTLARAAHITPDNHPSKSYYETILNNNIDRFSESIDVSANGAMPPYNNVKISPWEDDFLTWSVSQLLDFGYENARPLAEWKTKFTVQRMGYGFAGNKWCWTKAASYMITAEVGGSLLDDMNNIWDVNFDSEFNGLVCNTQAFQDQAGLAIGEMDGYAGAPSGYPSNMQPALAVAAELNGTDAIAAWTVFVDRAIKPDYSTYPVWAITPRTVLTDTDGDGIRDIIDPDDDDDGTLDENDAFPLDATETTDIDGDGIGDNADTTFTVLAGDVTFLITAINLANDETNNPGIDIIELADSGTYQLTSIVDATSGNSGLPAITSEIIIKGNGASILGSINNNTCDGSVGDEFRVFLVNGGNAKLTLDNTTVSDGCAFNSSGGGIAVINNGTLNLNNSAVINNTAQSSDGFYSDTGTVTINR